MITFTPGPWRVERGANSHLFDGIVCAGDEGIAFVGMDDDGPSPNARLIAAAPALYEALKDMREGWRYIREHHGDLYGVGWDRAEQAADAALAAATGDA
jgi:hypothetical protein